MKEALDKLIKRLILRKYPNIKDYEILVDTFMPFKGKLENIGSENYRVNYFMSPDENGEFIVTDEFEKISKLTKTLFKMLGPKYDQRFDDVEFYSNKD